MANSHPLFDPAHGFTGRATGSALSGARLVKVAGPKVDGQPVPIAYCGPTDHPIGVLEADTAQDQVGNVLPLQVQLIEAGGSVAVGPVEVVANGRIATLASGRKVGVAWQAASTGQFPLVQPTL